jgi:hypothetical protein
MIRGIRTRKCHHRPMQVSRVWHQSLDGCTGRGDNVRTALFLQLSSGFPASSRFAIRDSCTARGTENRRRGTRVCTAPSFVYACCVLAAAATVEVVETNALGQAGAYCMLSGHDGEHSRDPQEGIHRQACVRQQMHGSFN